MAHPSPVTLVDNLMNVPEVTRERVFTRDNNGGFSQRVIDALFRLATLDCCVLRGNAKQTCWDRYLKPAFVL